ncbi:hypothetical protein CMK19_16245 [Candidatus Poribacteria bacterium]|nr:hypothetical protein [Candidatus Poribacteria bacterium]
MTSAKFFLLTRRNQFWVQIGHKSLYHNRDSFLAGINQDIIVDSLKHSQRTRNYIGVSIRMQKLNLQIQTQVNHNL